MTTAKSELIQAHEAMAAVLDARLANLPEWKAFRAIDRALFAEIDRGGKASPPTSRRERPQFNGHSDQPPSYSSLTATALLERGKPIPTPKLMEFIGARRKLDADADRAKVTVTSTLSKNDKFKSVAWEGGRAWWFADRPVPKNESAG
jgi:hypothetical protein